MFLNITENWKATSEHDVNVSLIYSPLDEVLSSVHQTLFIVNMLLCTISLTFGGISWILISKSRLFQNYVCMNLIIDSAIITICFNMSADRNNTADFVVALFLVSRLIMSHWLLVATGMFYLKIVIVYNIEIGRKYLKASIFGWTLPFFEMLIFYALNFLFKISIVKLNYGLNMLILLIVFVLYCTVLRYIVILMLARKETWAAICQKILLCNYGLSVPLDLISMCLIFTLEMVHSSAFKYSIGQIVCLLFFAVGHISFLSLTRHREQWDEYKRRRRDSF